MAVLLFLRFGLVLMLIGLFSSLKNPFNIITTVNAAAYKKLEGGSPLKIQNSSPPKILFKKHSILLPCTPSLTDNILVTWYRNGEQLRNGHVFGNGTLKLPPNEKSNGIYRCLINDTNLEYGAVYSTETLVQYPVLKRLPAVTNQTVVIGDSFLINCPIESVPNANITWYFENNQIPKRYNETSFIQLTNGSLFINNISYSSQGKYKCLASNEFSMKTNRQYNIHINVESLATKNTIKNLYNLNIEKLVPSLQNHIIYVPVGQNYTLYCTGYRNDIKVEWWFASLLNFNEFTKISNNSKEFQILNANIEHNQGIYKCSTTSDLQLFRVIITTPPIIETPINSFESSITATIIFNCNVSSGNPQPNITWYRNGLKLENSYTIHINRNTLTIESLDLQDSGIYQCFAKNIAGESVSTAFVAIRQLHNIESLPEHPNLVKCFAVNYTTLNITFDSRQAGMFRMMNVYVASEKSQWTANIQQNLGSKNYFLIKGEDSVPIFDTFKLYLRSIVVTATRKVNGGQPENSVETSILSEGIDCATQGLDIHSIIYKNGIFIWWSNFKFIDVKSFIIQFLTNETDKNTFQFTNELNGTLIPINSTLSHSDIENKFQKIFLLNNLNNIFTMDINSYNFANKLLEDNADGEIFSIAVPGNVTGLFLPNSTKITVRIVSVTEMNKNLKQDLRYLQWRTFKDWTEIKVKNIESRKVNFVWNSLDKLSCIYVCYIKTYPSDHSVTECKNISMNSIQFSVTGLKPRTAYEMTFSECKSSKYYAHIEVYTKDDPPGPISNYTILKSKGVKLTWHPPINPNGKILNYFIYWTIKNQTHMTKLSGKESSFRFPNITEDEKFNITVRAAGDFGIGLPIYIDLNKLSIPLVLENENNLLTDHSLGIAIGTLLSIMCIVCFMFLFVHQRRKFKYHISASCQTSAAAGSADGGATVNQHQPEFQIQRTSSNDQCNFQPILNSTTNDENFHHQQQHETTERSIEFHEMQTLIPKVQHNHFHIITSSADHCTPLPNIKNKLQNGNSIIKCQTESINDLIENADDINCPIAVCSSTPLPAKRKIDSAMKQPVELVAKQQTNTNNYDNYNNTLTKISSSPNFSIHNSTHSNSNENGSAAITTEKLTNSPKLKYPLKKNDTVKLILPPNKKHSISSAISEPKLVNGHDNIMKQTIDSNSNTSRMDNNSQIKLIENNRSTCDKNYSQNSTNNYNDSSSNNCTESTLLHFIEDNSKSRTNSIGNHLKKNNWTQNRRPIIDPNG